MTAEHPRARRLAAAVALAGLAALGGAAPACGGAAPVAIAPDSLPPPSGAERPLAIVDVSVITMEEDRARAGQTVIVRDGRVAWLGAAREAPVPPDALVIPGRGRVLMPALIDMHAHVNAAELGAYVASGVGTVRNMWGTAAVARLRDEVASGARAGPTIVSASPGVDGTPPQWPGTLIVTAPESAAAVVRAQAAAGWRYLKVYTRLSPAVFDAVMAAARASGMTPVGHVPLAVDVRHALAEGMRSVEHLTGYDRAVSRSGSAGTFGWADADTTRYAALAEASAAAGVWNTPTLAIYAALAAQHPAAERERIVRNRRAFVRALARRDPGRILLGTDAGIGVVAPGTSAHDELAELVAAGLTPLAALRAGTVDAARFLGRPELGRVAAGGAADLLLLAADPLLDVANARRIEGVVLRGAWRPAASLAGAATGGAR